MRYLTCRLAFSEDAIHPMHAALAASDAPDRDLLWQWDHGGPGDDVYLFSIDSDEVGRYERALEETPLVSDFERTTTETGRHYVYVRQTNRPVDDDLLGALSAAGVLVVPPVEFAADATATMTVVGDPDALQDVVDGVPNVVSVAVERLGEFSGHPGRFDPALTARQTEAVDAAVRVGYFETPRSGSVADVADELDCSTGTAGEHLRKAQSKVMRSLVRSR
jgi:hypothetical protein